MIKNKVDAAGLSCFGIAAELAAKKAQGLGSFKERLFDSLGNLDGETVNRKQRITLL